MAVTHELPVYQPDARLNDRFEAVDRRLRGALADVPHVDRPIHTVLGASLIVTGSGSSAPSRSVKLLARTNAVGNVRSVAGVEGDGFWLSDEVARALKVGPGDEITLSAERGANSSRVRIDGVYRALWKEPPNPYWRSLSRFIYPKDPDDVSRGSGGEPPPTFLIGEAIQVFGLAARLEVEPPELRWEWPLTSIELTLEEAERLVQRFERFRLEAEASVTQIRVRPGCEGCPSFVRARVKYSTFLPVAVSEAKETLARVRGPADLLSGAGVLVACALVAATGFFSVARRRVEMSLLFARGNGVLGVGGRAAFEGLIPVVVGALAGLGVAAALVGALGPGRFDRAAVLEAARASALAVPVALALIGVVTAFAFLRMSDQRVPRFRFARRLPWELLALGAAGFLLYRLRTSGAFETSDGGAAARPSAAVLLFPIFFTAGFAGLAARLLRRPLDGVRSRGGGSGPAAYLAVRRLAGAHRLARLLVTAGALALGMFLYAQTVVRSLEETVEARSLLFVGSDVQGRTDEDRRVPARFPLPATLVTKMESGGTGGPRVVDVMAVDPGTLAAAAYWDKSWGSEPLEEIVDELRRRGGETLPVVVAGDVDPATTRLDIGGSSIPITVVGRARAFPGMSLRRPLIVADRTELGRLSEANGGYDPVEQPNAETQVWVKGDPRQAVPALESSLLRPFPILTADEVRKNPTIRSLAQTFAFLKALGLGAGALAIVGTLLYVQARQRNRVVSYALARRMGLRPRSHQLAIFLELASMLLASLAIGTLLAVVAARLVIVELDAPAELPSGPLFRTPWPLARLAALVLVATSIVGALTADASARRARIAEVIRSGD